MKKFKIYGGITIVVLFICFLMYSLMTFSYSEGERSGVVVKFSHKGMIFKSWEGDLNQGSIADGGIPKVWEFSVTDEGIVEKIKVAERKGSRITLVYNQYLISNPTSRSTNYVIVDVLDGDGVSVKGVE